MARHHNRPLRLGLFTVVCLSLWWVAGSSTFGETEPPEVFTIPGEYSIAYPGSGYRWSLVRTMEVDGVTGRVLLCSKDDGSSAMSVTIQHVRVASDHPGRVATLKGHYNALVHTLQQGGFEELKGEQPSVETPIPDRTDYSITYLKPSGDRGFVHGVTVFKRNTYNFQIFADTQLEAGLLISMVGTLRELTP